MPLKTFIIYAHKDKWYKEELEKFLQHLVRSKKIELWSDREIKAGEKWNEMIHLNLKEAEVILILVSVDFYNSNYIQDKEFKEAKERYDKNEVLLIPILVRSCTWEDYDIIGELQALPSNALPISKWDLPDDAFTNIAQQIKSRVDGLLKKKLEGELERHRLDEETWDRVWVNLEKTDDLAEKVNQIDEYLQQKDFINHRTEAEQERKSLVFKITREEKQTAARNEDEEKAWKEADKKDSVEAYKKYLEDGFGKYKTKAKERIKILKNRPTGKNGAEWREDKVAAAPKLICVEGGNFLMGGERQEHEDERPPHKVLLSSFLIGKYPVTFAEYDAFCHDKGLTRPADEGWGLRNERPAINVSWFEACKYCDWLSKKTGKKHRLPTEAEWEFAARGGTETGGFRYSGSDNISIVGWHKAYSNGKTQPVGRKEPNELGLHDMSGNVFEWCHDWYDKDYYKNSPLKNPTGAETGYHRVTRGGNWDSNPVYCRNKDRSAHPPDSCSHGIGFRVVCETWW